MKLGQLFANVYESALPRTLCRHNLSRLADVFKYVPLANTQGAAGAAAPITEKTGVTLAHWEVRFSRYPSVLVTLASRELGVARFPHRLCGLRASFERAVFNTPYGPFDGDSWERLCQQVFKKKFAADGYQHIPATPGDFGLEGFTTATGCGFQCYCPDALYSGKELHEKQRKKITEDLKKLQTYEQDLKKLLGATKLRRWYLVTPTIARNELVKHARSKEAELRAWNLSILAPDFEVLVQDGDHYAAEIQELQLAFGKALDFGGLPTNLPPLGSAPEVYENNILRKTKARLQGRFPADKIEAKEAQLNQRTRRDFLEHDSHFRRINDQAPTIHSRLMRLINGYEAYVLETRATWEGTPQQLTDQVREGLAERISKELAPHIDETGAALIARLMVARWIAVCELDYE